MFSSTSEPRVPPGPTGSLLPPNVNEAYLQVQELAQKINTIENILTAPLLEPRAESATFHDPDSFQQHFKDLQSQLARAIVETQRDIETDKRNAKLNAISDLAQLDEQLRISQMRLNRYRELSRSRSRPTTPFSTRGSVPGSPPLARDYDDTLHPGSEARPGSTIYTRSSPTWLVESPRPANFSLASTSRHVSPLPSRYSSPCRNPHGSSTTMPQEAIPTVAQQKDVEGIGIQQPEIFGRRGRSIKHDKQE